MCDLRTALIVGLRCHFGNVWRLEQKKQAECKPRQNSKRLKIIQAFLLSAARFNTPPPAYVSKIVPRSFASFTSKLLKYLAITRAFLLCSSCGRIVRQTGDDGSWRSGIQRDSSSRAKLLDGRDRRVPGQKRCTSAVCEQQTGGPAQASDVLRS